MPASGQCLPKTEKRTRNHPGRALVWLGSGVLRSLAELNGVNQGEGGQDFLQVIDSANFQGRIIIRFIFFLQYLGQIRSNKKTFVFRTVFLLAPEKRKIWFIDIGRHRGAYLCWVKWEASLVASEGQRRHGG